MSFKDILRNQEIKEYLIEKDEKLKVVFDSVEPSVFNEVYKPPYVALVGAIAGQLIRYEDAKRIRGNLYKEFGVDFSVNDIESVDDKKLKEIGLNVGKIEILRLVNRFILKHNLDLTVEEDLNKLIQVYGTGEWTLQTIRLTSNLKSDIFPSKDVFLRNRMKRLYDRKTRPSIDDAEEMAKKWSPYRSVVTWYLWRWF